jgi:putative transcriptional regulator
MNKSSFKARFGRLGRVRVIDRENSSSPASLVLRKERTNIRTIDATMALARRGLSMLRAKRAIERVVENGGTVVRVPNVGSITQLVGDLTEAGIKVSRIVGYTTATDLASILKATRERLELSQEEFALQYRLDLDALQNWEQGRRKPDQAAMNYLSIITRDPEAVARALEEELK